MTAPLRKTSRAISKAAAFLRTARHVSLDQRGRARQLVHEIESRVAKCWLAERECQGYLPTQFIPNLLRLELTSVSRRFWRLDSFATCLSARQVQPLDASQADNAHLREGTYDNSRGRSCEPNLSSQTCRQIVVSPVLGLRTVLEP